MKKFWCFLSILVVMFITSGCTSYITARYDDYNETFSGNAYYDPSYGRAAISLKSDVNGTICTGSTPFYQGIAVYNFSLICSDGRMITGSMLNGKYEGQAFTNRNETLSFVIAKSKKNFEKNMSAYRIAAQEKPALNAQKEKIQVIMQPNKF